MCDNYNKCLCRTVQIMFLLILNSKKRTKTDLKIMISVWTRRKWRSDWTFKRSEIANVPESESVIRPDVHAGKSAMSAYESAQWGKLKEWSQQALWWLPCFFGLLRAKSAWFPIPCEHRNENRKCFNYRRRKKWRCGHIWCWSIYVQDEEGFL